MTQKKTLSPKDEARLAEVKLRVDVFEGVMRNYREVVVEMVDKSSYREVARLTGLSTNTLQRWKREAGK